jgi:hypothetical protein
VVKWVLLFFAFVFELRAWIDTSLINDFTEVFVVAAAASLDFVLIFVDFTGVTFVATASLLRNVFNFVASELDDIFLSTLKASFFATFDT